MEWKKQQKKERMLKKCNGNHYDLLLFCLHDMKSPGWSCSRWPLIKNWFHHRSPVWWANRLASLGLSSFICKVEYQFLPQGIVMESNEIIGVMFWAQHLANTQWLLIIIISATFNNKNRVPTISQWECYDIMLHGFKVKTGAKFKYLSFTFF